MLPVQAPAEHHQQPAGHRHLHQAAQPGPAFCHVQQGQCARDCGRASELPAGKHPPSNKNKKTGSSVEARRRLTSMSGITIGWCSAVCQDLMRII